MKLTSIEMQKMFDLTTSRIGIAETMLSSLKLEMNFPCSGGGYISNKADDRALASLNNVLIGSGGNKLLFIMSRSVLEELIIGDPNQDKNRLPLGSSTLDTALARAVSSGMIIKVRSKSLGMKTKAPEFVIGPLYWKIFGIKKIDIIKYLEVIDLEDHIKEFKVQLSSIIKRLKVVDNFCINNLGQESIFADRRARDLPSKIKPNKEETAPLLSEENYIEYKEAEPQIIEGSSLETILKKMDSSFLTVDRLDQKSKEYAEDMQRAKQEERLQRPDESWEEFQVRLDRLDSYQEGFERWKELNSKIKNETYPYQKNWG